VIETSSDATRFVAMVAHELRGPLHAVPPLCGLVDDALSEGNVLQARRLVRLVAKQSHELIELSNALLGLSGIFGIAPEPVAVDLTACAREAVATVGAFPAHRDSDLSCIRIDRLPTVWGDPALLRQVFVNLIGNALKFARSNAGVAIEVGWEQGRDDDRIYVRDNGPGFSVEDSPQLFAPFVRLSRRGEEGHGLGLSIVRRIVENHGGRVWAEAAPDGGAAFYFTLGRARASFDLELF